LQLLSEVSKVVNQTRRWGTLGATDFQELERFSPHLTGSEMSFQVRTGGGVLELADSSEVILASFLAAPVLILQFRVIFRGAGGEGKSGPEKSVSIQDSAYEVFVHVSSNTARPLDVMELRQRMMDEFQERYRTKDPRVLRTVWMQFASYTQFISSGKLI
jgi:hypothetical protein